MKRFFVAAVAVALLASSAMAADVASVTESFKSWSTPRPTDPNFFNLRTGNTTYLTGEHPIQGYSANAKGFRYGGWTSGATATNNNNALSFGGQSSTFYTPAVEVIIFKLAVAKAGAYLYTIFDTTGGGTPNETVVNAESVTLVTAAVGATTEEMSCDIALLLRDDTGKWFKQIDGLQTITMANLAENTYNITLAGKNFQEVTGTAPADWNAMDATIDAALPGAISVSGTNVPAPTNVTGMGIVLATDAVGGTAGGIKFVSYTVTGSLPPAPGVAVTVNSNPVADGETVAVDLGSYEVAETAADVVFTVSNPGTLPLTVSGITVPANVTIVEDLTAGDIAAAGSDTFTVRINTAAEATISGEISFTTNVTGADTFNFAVSGNVGPVTAVREWEQY